MTRIVAVDVETHLIRPGLLAPPLVCVSWADEHGHGLLDRQGGTEFVRELLTDADTHLVLHNGSFDLAVLCAHDDSLVPLVFDAYRDSRIWDTKVREELADIARGRRQDGGATFVQRDGEWVKVLYSLAALVQRYLSKDRSLEKSDPNGWRLRFQELEDTPVEEWPAPARAYAIEDSTDTLEVFRCQGGVAGALPTEPDQVRAAWALHLMSVWGVRTDPDSVPRLKTQLEGELERVQKRLKACGLLAPVKCSAADVREGKVDFWGEVVVRGKQKPQAFRWARNTDRLAQYVERVYGRKGQTPPRTETGRIATDKNTLAESGSRLLRLVADGGGVEKILGTYVPVLEDGTRVPINARFNPLVNSGRTSCSGPNLQNLPTGRRVGGVRECFVPRPGHVYASVDYDTLELRALAQVNLALFGWSKMAEVINAGRDLHSAMAASMTGLSYEEVEKQKKVKGSKGKKGRDAAKVANFGYPGGLGAQSLVDYARTGYGLKLDQHEALALKRDWLAAWPEMRLYFNWINTRVGMGGARLEHPTTGYIRGELQYTEACNHQFQHLAALGAKRALFAVAAECYVDRKSALFGTRPVVFIHDEIVAEMPAAKADAASRRMAQVMCEAMSTVIPDIAISASPALMPRWFKEATDVYCAAGHLVPWTPDVQKASPCACY